MLNVMYNIGSISSDRARSSPGITHYSTELSMVNPGHVEVKESFAINFTGARIWIDIETIYTEALTHGFLSRT